VTIRWTKVDDYHQRSDCGQYSVAKVAVDGSTYFEAWYGREILARKLGDGAQMRQVCERHKARRDASNEKHENGDGV
jgi:hypothetical protein